MTKETKQYKEAKIEIIKLNKLFISLNKAWIREDKIAVLRCLYKIEDAIK